MKIFFFIFVVTICTAHLQAQTAADPATQAQITEYYKLAIQYKDGRGVPMDYTKAYDYFSKAAALGDAQSTYAMGYMLYKGLGCTQNYTTAAALFAKGAALGKDNSLYFYGLCWRNGYGVPKNEDSAKFYLNKSAALNYKQAVLELQSLAAENSNDSAAAALVKQIHNAAIPDKSVFNQYKKIQHHLPTADVVAGQYTGWLLQYDWGGTHIVSSKKLQLDISASGNKLSGQWIEENADTAAVKASLSGDSILFSNTKYKRKDHYSPDSGIVYTFENAKLNLVQAGDSVFIAGTVDMFSPQRGEPSKPLFIVLSRNVLLEDTATKLIVKVYPNPFASSITVEFALPQKQYVEVQLLTIGGDVIYRNPAGVLAQGWYNLPVQVNNIAAGSYLVKVLHGKQSTIVKVVKQ